MQLRGILVCCKTAGIFVWVWAQKSVELGGQKMSNGVRVNIKGGKKSGVKWSQLLAERDPSNKLFELFLGLDGDDRPTDDQSPTDGHVNRSWRASIFLATPFPSFPPTISGQSSFKSPSKNTVLSTPCTFSELDHALFRLHSKLNDSCGQTHRCSRNSSENVFQNLGTISSCFLESVL